MALGTFSKFYYGIEITPSNYKLDFDEGSGALVAELELGVFSHTQMQTKIKDAMDAVGTKVYDVSFNRISRKFTIACDSGTFDLLIDTGDNSAIAPWGLLGFTGGVDLTGAGSYEAVDAAGYEYRPQFWLQDYTAPTEWIEKADASVNITSSGRVETISFGTVNFCEFTMKFITDLPMDNVVIRNNPNGVADANHFLTFCIKRGPIEFMPDVSDVNTFYTIQLESTSANSKGVGYRLREETSRNLPGFYDSGLLKWRLTE